MSNGLKIFLIVVPIVFILGFVEYFLIRYFEYRANRPDIRHKRELRYKEWHRWFAWRPVYITDDNGFHIIWFKDIERLKHYGGIYECNYYTYRFRKEM